MQVPYPMTTTFFPFPLATLRAQDLTLWYRNASPQAVALLTTPQGQPLIQLVRVQEGLRWEEAGQGEVLPLREVLLRILWRVAPPGR
jgi:hypothetical protein